MATKGAGQVAEGCRRLMRRTPAGRHEVLDQYAAHQLHVVGNQPPAAAPPHALAAHHGGRLGAGRAARPPPRGSPAYASTRRSRGTTRCAARCRESTAGFPSSSAVAVSCPTVSSCRSTTVQFLVRRPQRAVRPPLAGGISPTVPPVATSQRATAPALRRQAATTRGPEPAAAAAMVEPFGDGSSSRVPVGSASRLTGDSERADPRGPAATAPSSAARATAEESRHRCGQTVPRRAQAIERRW